MNRSAEHSGVFEYLIRTYETGWTAGTGRMGSIYSAPAFFTGSQLGTPSPEESEANVVISTPVGISSIP